jgi:hypothetical protein
MKIDIRQACSQKTSRLSKQLQNQTALRQAGLPCRQTPKRGKITYDLKQKT